MIRPFARREHRPGVISYGLSSYGYDIRLADEYRVFTSLNPEGSALVDPKNFTETCFVAYQGPHCIIPPNSFVLGRSLETFHIPRDVLGVCVGKSTLARCGLIVAITPLEPVWHGQITIEISNTTPLPAKVYSNEGVAQIVFHRADTANALNVARDRVIVRRALCQVSYADKQGKYQGQRGVVLPQVDR
jgi:dCTP deaminase